LHHGQHGLPHLGADAVVVDTGQRLQVDAVQQLAVEPELQFLVFGSERGGGGGVAQQALLPTRFGGAMGAGGRHLDSRSRGKTSTFFTAPPITIIWSGTAGGAAAGGVGEGGAAAGGAGAAAGRGGGGALLAAGTWAGDAP